MLKSILCDNIETYILVKGTIKSVGVDAAARQNKKKYILKLCTIYWLHKWNKQYASR